MPYKKLTAHALRWGFVLWAFFLMCGFVHIGPSKPKLPVTRDAPQVTFYWNGSYPTIEDKYEIEGGLFADASDEDFFLTLLQLAFGKWNLVNGSYLVMQVATDQGIGVDAKDEINAVVVEELDSITAVASAMPNFRKDSGGHSDHADNPKIIQDCDIMVSNNTVSARSLYSTLIHEIGHCIGLGHPHTNSKSIMSYARTDGEVSLGLDDIAGITYLYPSKDAEVKEAISCGTIGGSKGLRYRSEDGRWWLLAALMATPLVVAFLPRSSRGRRIL